MKEGILISGSVRDIKRPGVDDYNAHEAIRSALEKNLKFEHRDLVMDVYRRTDIICQRLFPVIHTPSFEGRLPAPIVSVEDERNWKVLASYRLVPDGYGLDHKLTLNEEHIKDGKWVWGEWSLYETITHEVGHEYHQVLGKDPYRPGDKVTHKPEFRALMANLGIHCDARGVHTAPADEDKPFAILMREWGIARPDMEGIDTGKQNWFFSQPDTPEKKGRSTLTKYECPSCGLKVRYGRQDEPFLMHVPCGELLVRK
jgi:hypothetical protein